MMWLMKYNRRAVGHIDFQVSAIASTLRPSGKEFSK
jgi:hypothetical protein